MAGEKKNVRIRVIKISREKVIINIDHESGDICGINKIPLGLFSLDKTRLELY